MNFTPTGVQVTKETDGLNDAAVVSAVIDPLSRVPKRGGTFNRCEPGTDILVYSATTNGSPDGQPVAVGFFIEISR
jgi:hypothetical protein